MSDVTPSEGEDQVAEEAAQATPVPAAAAEAPQVAAPTAAAPAPAGSDSEEGRANRRKIREGLVISVKMENTAVIGVIDRVRHPRYARTVQRTKRLYAHNTDAELKPGDRVRLAETRPLSKLKRWRIVEVLERAK